MKQLLTVKQVAKILQVHPKSVYRFVKQDRIKAMHLGGNRIRFTELAVRDFLKHADCGQP